MRRILCLFLGTLLFAAAASAQSLGELARKQKQQKKPTAKRVITNDDLKDTPSFNNGAASNPEAAKPADASDARAGAEAKPAEAAEASAPAEDEKAKLVADWRTRLDEQKKAVSMAERELDVLQREYKMRVAAYYSDVGNRFRDEKTWGEQDRKYQADIKTKEAEVAGQRQRFEDMKEQARKAGVPTNVLD